MEYLFITSLRDSLSCTSCVWWLKKCEAKNFSKGLEVARPLPRIPCFDVLRTLGGSSDSFSNKDPD